MSVLHTFTTSIPLCHSQTASTQQKMRRHPSEYLHSKRGGSAVHTRVPSSHLYLVSALILPVTKRMRRIANQTPPNVSYVLYSDILGSITLSQRVVVTHAQVDPSNGQRTTINGFMPNPYNFISRFPRRRPPLITLFRESHKLEQHRRPITHTFEARTPTAVYLGWQPTQQAPFSEGPLSHPPPRPRFLSLHHPLPRRSLRNAQFVRHRRIHHQRRRHHHR